MTRWIVAAAAVVALYLAGIPRNPPGFFIDEASIAYNALTIAQSGVDEHGERFPLFFLAFGEHKNPVYIYTLAAVFVVIGPSILAARLLSALFGIAAVLVLGRLAWVQTRDRAATLLTLGLAALTPGLFELSRLVFEVAAFPLAIALFLLAARRAYEARGGPLCLAATLALVTYTYTAGRILGPGLALLLALLLSWRKLVAAWLLYALALVPLAVWNAKTDGALTSRAGVVVRDGTLIAKNYVANLSPAGLVLRGDPNARHHVPRSGGPVLIATFLLALAAIVIGRRDRWVQFLLAGTLASVLPVAVAVDIGHALRLSGLFVFLIALAIPAMRGRHVMLAAAVLGVLQGAFFFHAFHTRGAERVTEFNAGIQGLVFDALDQRQRPVYLDAGPGAIFAYWFGALRGEERTAFALLQPGVKLPAGAIYIGGAARRPDSVVIGTHGPFGVHRIITE
ncbi:MAG TPA: hypothetical protein VNI54_07920 [Thermoanaerobaculia bacterium]|nr:hypothetical protein [Thermoanaerobaculia bacterium]